MSWTKEQLANHPRLGQLIGIMPAKKKATDDQIRDVYLETGSVWITGQRLGMCGQSVHERVQKLGIIQSNFYTPEVQKKIELFYAGNFKTGDLDIFCKANGFLKPNVCRWARERGLTRRSRKASDSVRDEMSKRHKEWMANNIHPRGMAGKHHSKATVERLRQTSSAMWKNMPEEKKAERNFKIIKTRHANGTLNRPRFGTSWKSGWREIGGIRKFYRSRWEANYARYLEFQKRNGLIKSWVHESETFWFEGVRRGCVSYLPDFKITTNDGSIEFHEVKGWMDGRSKTKIRRMAKYHPDVKLIIRSGDWFKANKNLASIIQDWE